eukprot:TRINITY_DN10565_c0_g1_i1.p1 TRINITY_DN10565_c0_g1~~TRINITY_DN10565_c0_g1_i1.p1  ORF type:complete len:156 (-),score=17.16 TRINITY_DN10565_c0_g1_i1:14-481(-)
MRLLGLTLIFASITIGQSSFLSCYIDVEGREQDRCREDDGYNTCFTSYDINGQVTARGCSTEDNICVNEHSVQSRHLYGFLSSLGCASKEKIGRLLRGRDCENHLVDNKFERFCYCRYHGCNHRSTYYSGAQGAYRGATWGVAVLLCWLWGYVNT